MEEFFQKAIPFHPACFQIFAVVSRKLVGKVDMDGLANLRNGLYSNVSFPGWGSEVEISFSDVWLCHRGYEHLAANPVFVPGFRDLCQSAVSHDGTFDAYQSPFPERHPTRQPSPTRNDPFLELPVELKVQIVMQLSSEDIAALGLSSRAFTHLPTTVWRDLLIKELPWIYEAWSDDATPYRLSYFACAG
jgi:hypothetical protein